MSSSQEVRTHWQALSAATVGLAFGYSFNNYTTNVMAPHLMQEFGWSKSAFALLGLVVVLAIICQPLAGRLADLFGERRIALIGVVSAPLLYLLLSRLGGAFWQFAAISAAQVILVGGTTSVVVYTRQIARNFDKARGLALGVASCAPAVAGALAAPLLTTSIDEFGWRSTYLVAGLVVALFGALALALMGPGRTRTEARDVKAEHPRLDFRALAVNRPFRIIMAGTLLCNLTITLQMSQISIVLAEAGITSVEVGFLISLYGGSSIAGRLLCGLALDRLPPHLISALAMSAPAIGLLVLATGTNSLPAVTFALATLGLALGAEGDVGAYMVMRYFSPAVYSSVIGLVVAALAASGALGALLLSAALALTGKFATFLAVCSAAAAIGGSLFLLLGRYKALPEEVGSALRVVAS